MKRYPLLFFIIIFLVSLPITSLAEEWGENGRRVDEMLTEEEENTNKDTNRVIDEEVEKNEETDENEENSEDLFTSSRGQNVFFLFLQMFVALAIIVFLIYALLKLFNKRSKRFGSHSTIENIGGVSLGQNKSVQIVRIGSKLYILGVGDSVQLIKEITDEEEVERIIAEHNPSEVFDQPISKVSQWLKKRFVDGNAAPQQEQSFQQLLQRELREVKDSQTKVHSVLKEKNDD